MAEMLKEFLVGLGFKVDPASAQKFQQGINDAGKAAKKASIDHEKIAKAKSAKERAEHARYRSDLAKDKAEREKLSKEESADSKRRIGELDEEVKAREKAREASQASLAGTATGFVEAGAAIAAVSIAVVKAVEDVAHQVRSMYYSAERSGTSIGNMQAFQYAANQIGVAAEAAGASVNALYNKITGIGGQGFEAQLNQWGVRTREANGQLRDSTETYIDTLKALQSMEGRYSHGVVTAFAAEYGINKDDLEQFERHPKELAAAYAKGKEIVPTSETGKASTDLANKADTVATQAFHELAKGAETLKPAVDAINDTLSKLMSDFDRLDGKTQEVVEALGALALAIGGVAALGWLKNMAGGLAGRLAGKVPPTSVAPAGSPGPPKSGWLVGVLSAVTKASPWAAMASLGGDSFLTPEEQRKLEERNRREHEEYNKKRAAQGLPALPYTVEPATTTRPLLDLNRSIGDLTEAIRSLIFPAPAAAATLETPFAQVRSVVGRAASGISEVARKVFAPLVTGGRTMSAISLEAQRQGVDPNLALTSSWIESRFNPGSKTGSYQGIYQLNDEDWKALGGTEENRNDPAKQIELGIKRLGEVQRALSAKLGREAKPWEVYFAHQQGVSGAAALLNASPGATATQALERFRTRKYDPAKAVTGNIPSDYKGDHSANISAAEFVDLWRQKFAAFSVRFLRYQQGQGWSWDLDFARAAAAYAPTRSPLPPSAYAPPGGGQNARPGVGGAPAPPVVINATTSIYVAAGATADSTAKAVHLEQNRVNADLLRNTQGALR